MFVDSHTHLADPAFDQDRSDVVARARAAGCVAAVCIGESLAAADRAERLAAEHSGFLWWTAGVHPHDAASFEASRDLPAIEAHLDRGAVAVGECGLDYHYDHSPRDLQRAAFAAQLQLAGRRGVPVVVHTREAESDTISMLADAGSAGVRGVLHCFTGSPELAEAAVAAGWSVSFSGIITFRRWADDAIVRALPPDRLLVESDAPYLAPVPFRGKRNEPAHVRFTVERLALALGVPASDAADLTTRNARRFFGLATGDAPG